MEAGALASCFSVAYEYWPYVWLLVVAFHVVWGGLAFRGADEAAAGA